MILIDTLPETPIPPETIKATGVAVDGVTFCINTCYCN
jgi:hypothetical protein